MSNTNFRDVIQHNDGFRTREWIGTANSANKSIPQGNELLAKIQQRDLTYDDSYNLLFDDTLYDESLDKILENFKPRHKIALVSLCTSTRPYSKSVKWSTFIERYNNLADMIIWSSGGIIPIEYECCYPYLNYDDVSPYPPHLVERYIQVGIIRLEKFFTKFKYDKVIFAFKYDAINIISVNEVMPGLVERGLVGSYAIVPNNEHYETLYKGRSDVSLIHKYNPLLYPALLELIDKEVGYVEPEKFDISDLFT